MAYLGLKIAFHGRILLVHGVLMFVAVFDRGLASVEGRKGVENHLLGCHGKRKKEKERKKERERETEGKDRKHSVRTLRLCFLTSWLR